MARIAGAVSVAVRSAVGFGLALAVGRRESEHGGRRRGRDGRQVLRDEAVKGVADAVEGSEVGDVGGGEVVAAVGGGADEVAALAAEGD